MLVDVLSNGTVCLLLTESGSVLEWVFGNLSHRDTSGWVGSGRKSTGDQFSYTVKLKLIT